MRKWKVLAASALAAMLVTSSGNMCMAATSTAAETAFGKSQVEVLKKNIHNAEICVDKGQKKQLKKLDVSNKNTMTTFGSTSGSGSATTVSGTYPTRKGMILVTGDYYKNLIPTGHAAILYSSTKVVEALADGVVVGRNDWNTTRTTCYAGSVRSTTTAQDASAADWCYTKIGTPYNYNYFNTSTRSKFYCSQLVYSAFLDLYGIDLNTSDFDIPLLGNPVHPLELLDNNYTYVTYRQE